MVCYITSGAEILEVRLSKSAMEQLRVKRSFVGSAITKAISTIHALLSDGATPGRVLHQPLELVLAKQVDDHLDHLLAMAPIRSSADLDKFRNLYDEITFRTSALEGLGVSPGEYPGVLRRVIMKALPPDLGILYRQWLKEASTLNHNSDCRRQRLQRLQKMYYLQKQVKHLMTFLPIQVEARQEGALNQASSSANQRHHPREFRPLELTRPLKGLCQLK
ncbi:hypothetical protein HPB49_007715 [Dermacentor silvarum]|uniref:Uncharacterized protein n=1 Tax=Dermacentor silvarum TaxID=543639 RepID=A0ACB8CQN5_DERSI|nr:hypothetical protein HPB49_007715 [Dermacentor silvarum]